MICNQNADPSATYPLFGYINIYLYVYIYIYIYIFYIYKYFIYILNIFMYYLLRNTIIIMIYIKKLVKKIIQGIKYYFYNQILDQQVLPYKRPTLIEPFHYKGYHCQYGTYY